MANGSTLRGLMGLGDTPAPLADSALVMIDCQNTYRQGRMQLSGVEAAITQARDLLARARRAGTPVVHVMHDAGEGSPYDVRSEIGQISDEVAPNSDEPVIVKNYPNAFVDTDLLPRLHELTATQDLVFAGFMTHMCINSTARGAFTNGFRPTVVANATATRDLPSPDGSIVPATSIQQASLAALTDLFSIVVTSSNDLPD
jgi:nicotinamidase-related amidase